MPDLDKTQEELLEEIRALRRRGTERKALEEDHLRTVRDLRERVKELNCLYSISRLAQRTDLPLDDLGQSIVELLPRSWQFPETACASIDLGELSHLGGRRYRTPNYRRTPWRQGSPVIVRGEQAGWVEICYLEERPKSDEGPFLKEERHLIDAVADQLGRIVEARQAEEHMRVLSRELIRAQESERQRIARELHDNVAQDLSLLRMASGTLLAGQPAPSPTLRQAADELSARLGAAVAAVRDLSYDLLPPGLDQLGLVSTSFRFCEEFSVRHDLEVEFFADGMDALKLDFETQINLYRIIQEGLANVRQHAQATKVVVRLLASHPSILLRIEDDGRGFDASERAAVALGEKRMGLWSMRERVRLLGGRMSIRSRLEQGTRIHVEVPYRGDE